MRYVAAGNDDVLAPELIMWFESQNCAMMGLQATTGKRKLEAATAPGESSPPKNGRWEADDCIARLQAVAVPAADTWRSPTPSLAATLLSSDDFDDDDEFDDELSDDGVGAVPEPARFVQHPYTTGPQTNASTTNNNSNNNTHHHHQHHHHPQARYQPDYWQYYSPPQQQTIRREENGKSYLELGAAPPTPLPAPLRRCCDGRTRWCHVPCYRQRRLAVLNLSMCKLARYRQCSDPSLRRSVLICNTLRRLEREMEAEPPPPLSLVESPAFLPEMTAPTRPAPVDVHCEQSLREMTCASGRATPFPSGNGSNTDTDSGLGDDETMRPINWGSVLSLTTQTDLESMNNNDEQLYAADLGFGVEAPEWIEASTSTRTDDWDGFVHVLVGGT